MDETPNDSGASHASPTEDVSVIDEVIPAAHDAVQPTATPENGSMAPAPPRSEELRRQIRRPAVWGLLVMIAVVLIVQIWLLFIN
jgi:hypothetical protein